MTVQDKAPGRRRPPGAMTDTAGTVSNSIITRADPGCKTLSLPPKTPVCSRDADPVLTYYKQLVYEAVEADNCWLRDIRTRQYNAAFEDWLFWLFWDAESVRIAM